MTKFRPCIDLHAGQVKQIVGGTLDQGDEAALRTNHVSLHPAGHFARLYRDHGLRGGHVIMLGPRNDDAAAEALAAWPRALQVGGGITDQNAPAWIEKGAEKVGGLRPLLPVLLRLRLLLLLLLLLLLHFGMSRGLAWASSPPGGEERGTPPEKPLLLLLLATRPQSNQAIRSPPSLPGIMNPAPSPFSPVRRG